MEMACRTACNGLSVARLTEGLGANVVTARNRADQMVAPRIEDHPVMAHLATTEVDEDEAFARVAKASRRQRRTTRPPTPAA